MATPCSRVKRRRHRGSDPPRHFGSGPRTAHSFAPPPRPVVANDFPSGKNRRHSHRPGVTGIALQPLAGRHVPQLDHAIRPGGGQQLAVGRKANFVHRSRMGRDRLQRSARRRVPHGANARAAADRHHLAVGRPGHAFDDARLQRQRIASFGSGQVPDDGGPIPAAGNQLLLDRARTRSTTRRRCGRSAFWRARGARRRKSARRGRARQRPAVCRRARTPPRPTARR